MKVTNSAAHIEEYIDGTIERLGFAPDLYYLHRIDPDTPLTESIPALDKIRKQGKTKYIGLSECSAATLRKAHSSRLPPNTFLYMTDQLSSRQDRRCASRILGLRNRSRNRRLDRRHPRAGRRLRRLQPPRPRLARRRLQHQVTRRLCP